MLKFSHQIQQLFALNDPEKGITVNVGMIEGGISPNVVAPESSAVVDVRVPTMKDAELVEQKIFSLKALALLFGEMFWGKDQLFHDQPSQKLSIRKTIQI